MPADYGLSAMTGVLPVIMVGGMGMMMTERLFDRAERIERPRRRPARSTRRRTRRPSRSPIGFGDFSNVLPGRSF